MHSVGAMIDYSRTAGVLHTFGTGAPLALAHGAGGSVRENFGDLAAGLPGRRLFGFDYPGSGERPPHCSALDLDSLADELVTAVDTAGFDRVPALGLSLGSAVAVTAAVRHPGRISGLILTVGFSAADAQSAAFARLYAHLATGGDVAALAKVLLLSSSSAALGSLDPQSLILAEAELASAVGDHGAKRVPQMDLVASVDIRALLPQVRVPTLVIAAGHDRIVLPQTTRGLAAGIPGAELVELTEAGHIFTPTETTIWASSIEGFLVRHEL